jgi:hypothetical protein
MRFVKIKGHITTMMSVLKKSVVVIDALASGMVVGMEITFPSAGQ